MEKQGSWYDTRQSRMFDQQLQVIIEGVVYPEMTWFLSPNYELIFFLGVVVAASVVMTGKFY